jgi:signal peptidase II
LTARNLGFAAAAGAFLADQASKLLLLYGLGFASLASGAKALSMPLLNVVMAWNPGISFSFFAAQSRAGVWAIAMFEIVAIIALGVWLWRATRQMLTAGLGLVIGGALGNLTDRLIYGRVADFFDLHAFGREFFACNLADVAITFGVILLLADTLVDDAAKPKPKEAA